MRTGKFLFSFSPRNLAPAREWGSRRGLSLPSHGQQLAGTLQKLVCPLPLDSLCVTCEAKGFIPAPDGPKEFALPNA